MAAAPEKGGGAPGGRHRRQPPWRCWAGRGMGPVPPAALSPPGGVGRDRLPPAAADGERRDESEPKLPLLPGAQRGAGRCGAATRGGASGRAPGPPAPRRAEGVSGRHANMADSPACGRRRGGRGRPGTGARAAPWPPFPPFPRPRRAREGGGAAGSAGSGGSAAALTWRIPAEGGCVVSSPSAAGAVPRGGRPVPAGRCCLSQRAPSGGGGGGRPRPDPSRRAAAPDRARRAVPSPCGSRPRSGSLAPAAGLGGSLPLGCTRTQAAPSGPGGAAV